MDHSIDIYVMIVSIIIVLVLLLGFIVAFMLIYKNRQIRNELELKQTKEQYHREILKAELESKEKTLRNISEEIHDNVGQVLSLVILNLSAIDLQQTDAAGRKLDSITGLVQKVVADLRHLSKTLDAENIVTAGLPAIIQYELEQLERTGVYTTSFRLAGLEQRLDPYQEIVVYRMVQEVIQNVIKHARATAVSVMLAYAEEDLTIRISDNGRGFNTGDTTPSALREQGAGLTNMRKRAALISASIQLRSAPAQGTDITIAVPLKAPVHV